ncbi:hypothetical protein [Nostoc sp. JL23]|uniref:hypothetical protein n=1 Tax=Nostoc sp. JL23 TaxID=2815394 RepID=UPI001D34E666|nr:hypothetical protein [Nostoc sp. JL23]MBN3875228.1 hypothetical protein [Nostoc sp. JL23]
MPRKLKKRIVPNPRQPLTKKAKRAILKYVEIKTARFPNIYAVIEQTLIAEKMRRENLYGWLESKGYKWKGLFWENNTDS